MLVFDPLVVLSLPYNFVFWVTQHNPYNYVSYQCTLVNTVLHSCILISSLLKEIAGLCIECTALAAGRFIVDSMEPQVSARALRLFGIGFNCWYYICYVHMIVGGVHYYCVPFTLDLVGLVTSLHKLNMVVFSTTCCWLVYQPWLLARGKLSVIVVFLPLLCFREEESCC